MNGARERSECKEIERYLVRASDLKKVFRGKKVFGFNDSCRSGDVDFGPNSLMINATQKSEDAQDKDGLSLFLREVALKPVGCGLDANGDGKIDFSELATAFPADRKRQCKTGIVQWDLPAVKGTCLSTQASQIRGGSTESARLQNPVHTGGASGWPSCFAVGGRQDLCRSIAGAPVPAPNATGGNHETTESETMSP